MAWVYLKCSKGQWSVIEVDGISETELVPPKESIDEAITEFTNKTEDTVYLKLRSFRD